MEISLNTDYEPIEIKSKLKLTKKQKKQKEKEAEENQKRRAKIALWVATCFTFVFMVLEIVGGWIAGSLAIMTDAAHLLTDIAAMCLSLLAMHISEKPANSRASYGYYRAEILGALASIVTIWALVGILLFEATIRFMGYAAQTGEEVNGKIMTMIGSLGLVVNIIDAIILYWGNAPHSHSHGFLSDDDGHDHSHDHGHGHSHKKKHKLGQENEMQILVDESHSIDLEIQSDLIEDDHHSHNHKKENIKDKHNHDHEHEHEHEHEKDESGSDHDDKHGNDHGHKNKHQKHKHDKKNKHSHDHDDHKHDDHKHNDHDHDDHKHDDDHDHDDKHGHDDKHEHEQQHEGNINVRSALIHVIGDCFQSIGVIIAAVIIWVGNVNLTGKVEASTLYCLADPIATFIFGIITLFTTFNIIGQILNVLMEGVPKNIDFDKVFSDLKKIECVHDVHDLHIWSLTIGRVCLSCHLSSDDPIKAIKLAKKVCKKYGIKHTTIQVDPHTIDDCEHTDCN
eukprot:TRINITY_DN1108_c1_g1_i2.p1 TRINITY_DN1108_c1_g1~~TRINITY_DN1108_c1_g1_i2.p1  ORF type:complete len:508 (+),score=155.06 TRINITY_DN1108_c1_g1_i2:233-1756(+)